MSLKDLAGVCVCRLEHRHRASEPVGLARENSGKARAFKALRPPGISVRFYGNEPKNLNLRGSRALPKALKRLKLSVFADMKTDILQGLGLGKF